MEHSRNGGTVMSLIKKFILWLFPKKVYEIDTLGKKFYDKTPDGIFINRYLDKERIIIDGNGTES